MKIAAATVALLLSAIAGTPLAWCADGPPANLKPAKVQGAGLNIIDMEGQKAWYAAKLGMTIIATGKYPDGSPYEYMMGYPLGPDTVIIRLRKWPAGQPQPNAMGRIILGVPNAKGLTDWLRTQGVDSVQVLANVSYSITDPEGNVIELYSPLGNASTAVSQPRSPCGSGPTRSRLLVAALEIMRDGNAFESAQGQEMYAQGLRQQGVFDEEYARCLRSNPTP